MADIIRAALVQTNWTGDKESMIKAHEEYARRGRRAGREGHLLPGAVLRPVLLPGAGHGSTTSTPSRSPARPPSGSRRSPPSSAWSWSCRCTSRSSPASSTTPRPWSTPTAATSASTARHHIPQVKGFWEKFYFRPGNLGYPVFDTAVGKVGVYICYDRHFPEGWRALGLNGAQIVFNPSATSRGLSSYLWQLEQPASAVANEYFIGAINRVGIEDLGDNDFYGTSYFVDPEGKFVGEVGDAHKPELIVRDLDLDLLDEVRDRWQFYRDRRPDAYGDLDPAVRRTA